MDERDRIEQDADPLDLLLSQRSRSHERSRERLGQREDSDPPPDFTAEVRRELARMYAQALYQSANEMIEAIS